MDLKPSKLKRKRPTLGALGRLYEDAFENAPCALLVVDQELRILDFNRTAFGLFQAPGNPMNALLGDALRCENAVASPNGCGTSEQCPKCRFRIDAKECLRTGRVTKSIVTMIRATGSGLAAETFMVDSAVACSNENRLVVAVQRMSDWDSALEAAASR